MEPKLRILPPDRKSRIVWQVDLPSLIELIFEFKKGGHVTFDDVRKAIIEYIVTEPKPISRVLKGVTEKNLIYAIATQFPLIKIKPNERVIRHLDVRNHHPADIPVSRNRYLRNSTSSSTELTVRPSSRRKLSFSEKPHANVKSRGQWFVPCSETNSVSSEMGEAVYRRNLDIVEMFADEKIDRWFADVSPRSSFYDSDESTSPISQFNHPFVSQSKATGYDRFLRASEKLHVDCSERRKEHDRSSPGLTFGTRSYEMETPNSTEHNFESQSPMNELADDGLPNIKIQDCDSIDSIATLEFDDSCHRNEEDDAEDENNDDDDDDVFNSLNQEMEAAEKVLVKPRQIELFPKTKTKNYERKTSPSKSSPGNESSEEMAKFTLKSKTDEGINERSDKSDKNDKVVENEKPSRDGITKHDKFHENDTNSIKEEPKTVKIAAKNDNEPDNQSKFGQENKCVKQGSKEEAITAAKKYPQSNPEPECNTASKNTDQSNVKKNSVASKFGSQSKFGKSNKFESQSKDDNAKENGNQSKEENNSASKKDSVSPNVKKSNHSNSTENQTSTAKDNKKLGNQEVQEKDSKVNRKELRSKFEKKAGPNNPQSKVNNDIKTRKQSSSGDVAKPSDEDEKKIEEVDDALESQTAAQLESGASFPKKSSLAPKSGNKPAAEDIPKDVENGNLFQISENVGGKTENSRKDPKDVEKKAELAEIKKASTAEERRAQKIAMRNSKAAVKEDQTSLPEKQEAGEEIIHPSGAVNVESSLKERTSTTIDKKESTAEERRAQKIANRDGNSDKTKGSVTMNKSEQDGRNQSEEDDTKKQIKHSDNHKNADTEKRDETPTPQDKKVTTAEERRAQKIAMRNGNSTEATQKEQNKSEQKEDQKNSETKNKAKEATTGENKPPEDSSQNPGTKKVSTAEERRAQKIAMRNNSTAKPQEQTVNLGEDGAKEKTEKPVDQNAEENPVDDLEKTESKKPATAEDRRAQRAAMRNNQSKSSVASSEQNHGETSNSEPKAETESTKLRNEERRRSEARNNERRRNASASGERRESREVVESKYQEQQRKKKQLEEQKKNQQNTFFVLAFSLVIIAAAVFISLSED